MLGARALASSTVLLAMVLLASGCACGPTVPPYEGPRPDGGPPTDAHGGSSTDDDAGSGGGMDAWLDPRLDADLDAPVAPRDVGLDANRDVGPVDAFEHDAGSGSSGGDSGVVRRDAGSSRDTGPDARPPFGACGILWSRGDPLPDACLPRCSASTRDLFDACFGDAVCEATVMVRDTSRTGLLYVWDDRDVTEVDCEACVGTQRFSCWHEHCATQAEAWVDCVAVRMSEACARERANLDRCLEPHRAEVDACSTARVTACFPAR